MVREPAPSGFRDPRRSAWNLPRDLTPGHRQRRTRSTAACRRCACWRKRDFEKRLDQVDEAVLALICAHHRPSGSARVDDLIPTERIMLPRSGPTWLASRGSLLSGLADEDGLPAGIELLAAPRRRWSTVSAPALELLLTARLGDLLLDGSPDPRRPHYERADHPVRRRRRPLRPRPRPGGARRAEHGVEDVLRLRHRLRGRAELQVCPVCLALPGALPALNRTAVESAALIGLALGCQIAPTCRFARKNYFYPDMPKNFQTSQYDEPIAHDGELEIEVPASEHGEAFTFRVPIERAHMEEDTGEIAAASAGHQPHPRAYSFINFSRAASPDRDRHEADRGTRDARPRSPRCSSWRCALLRGLGVSDVRMEQARCAATRTCRCARRSASRCAERHAGPPRHPLRDEERRLAAQRRAAIRYEMTRTPRGSTPGRGSCRVTGTGARRPGVTNVGPFQGAAEDDRYFLAGPRADPAHPTESTPCARGCRRHRRCAGPAGPPTGASPNSAGRGVNAGAAVIEATVAAGRRRRRPASGGWATWPVAPTPPAPSARGPAGDPGPGGRAGRPRRLRTAQRQPGPPGARRRCPGGGGVAGAGRHHPRARGRQRRRRPRRGGRRRDRRQPGHRGQDPRRQARRGRCPDRGRDEGGMPWSGRRRPCPGDGAGGRLGG